MRIERLEAFLVRAQLVKPYFVAMETQGVADVNCVIVRLTTDNDLRGIGESDPRISFTYESPETVMQILRDHLGPAVLGLDPSNLVKLHLAMDSAVPGWPFAKAPLDIAAHDITGKALGVPVYQLLGGAVRERVPLIWAIGSGTPEENVEEVMGKVAEGYRTLHVKVGALSPEEDIARIWAIREAAGDEIAIMADVNQGWDRSTAIRTIRQLESAKLSMIEQPVKAWDIDGMSKIQAAFETPISADESLHSSDQALELIRRDAARVFSLKIGKCGGLLRTRQIAAMVEAAGLLCFVNSMFELGISVAASLHLAASVPNLMGHGHALMSNLRIKEDILVPGSFKYDGRDILVPQNCKGLGVEIDEDRLKRATLDRFVLER